MIKSKRVSERMSRRRALKTMLKNGVIRKSDYHRAICGKLPFANTGKVRFRQHWKLVRRGDAVFYLVEGGD